MNKEWCKELDYLMNKTTQAIYTIHYLSRVKEYDVMAENEVIDSYKNGYEKMALAFLNAAISQHNKWQYEFQDKTILDDNVINSLRDLGNKTTVHQLFYAFNKAACIHEAISLNNQVIDAIEQAKNASSKEHKVEEINSSIVLNNLALNQAEECVTNFQNESEVDILIGLALNENKIKLKTALFDGLTMQTELFGESLSLINE